jgi:hypothetical protein
MESLHQELLLFMLSFSKLSDAQLLMLSRLDKPWNEAVRNYYLIAAKREIDKTFDNLKQREIYVPNMNSAEIKAYKYVDYYQTDAQGYKSIRACIHLIDHLKTVLKTQSWYRIYFLNMDSFWIEEIMTYT